MYGEIKGVVNQVSAKGLKYVLVVLFICMFFISSGFAQIYSYLDTMYVVNDSGWPGENIDVPVYLVNTFNVGGFSFRIPYDEQRLQVESVSLTERSSMFTISGMDTTNPGVLFFLGAPPDPMVDYIPPGSGPVAVIGFLINNDAIPGEVNLEFIDSLLGDNSLSDSTGLETIIPVLVGATISVLGEVNIDESVSFPDGFVLLKNYPNPFNSATRIEFGIGREGRAVIEIFDILGRKVRKLDFGVLSPGIHSIIWDGRDDFAREVSSGVYCYSLYFDEISVLSKRMVFLR